MVLEILSSPGTLQQLCKNIGLFDSYEENKYFLLVLRNYFPNQYLSN